MNDSNPTKTAAAPRAASKLTREERQAFKRAMVRWVVETVKKERELAPPKATSRRKRRCEEAAKAQQVA